MITIGFLVSSAIILITPGPTNTLLASCGAALGMRKAALLPLAEAAGYVIAISGFVLMAAALRDHALVSAAVKLVAALWLAHCAFRLWQVPAMPDAVAPADCLSRVFLTTLLNPKAMLVGTVFIPSGPGAASIQAVFAYALMSTFAGFAWVAFGSMLPAGVKRHSFRFASVVLGGFSLAALTGAVYG